jgi:hypothetical protein
MTAYAVVLTHDPTTGETWHTPFTSEHHEDPLSFAHLFRESEEEAGDFPGCLWVVTGNDEARDIRKAALMASLGFSPEPDR